MMEDETICRDFEAETDVKYPGLNGNCLTRKRKSK